LAAWPAYQAYLVQFQFGFVDSQGPSVKLMLGREANRHEPAGY